MAVPSAGSLVRASDAFNFTTFTPSFSSFTVGSGADVQGWWQQLGNFIFWGFRVEMGTSPSWSSSVLLTLPAAAYTGAGAQLAANCGGWSARSASGANWGGPIVTNDSGGTQVRFTGAWSGTAPSANVGVTTSTPFTPAAGNVLSGGGVYRAL